MPWFPLLAALTLFLSAGSLDWAPGCFCIRAIGVSWFATVIFLAVTHPELLRRRRRPSTVGPAQPAWDANLLRALHLSLLLLLSVAGWESGRSGTPLELSRFAFGLLLLVIGTLLLCASLYSNPYFETEVRYQPEQGQKVVRSGAYALIRHPGYLALIFLLGSLPWMLQSSAAGLPWLVCVAILVVRLRREESYLQEHLPDYRQYCQTVRFRLLPGIW